MRLGLRRPRDDALAFQDMDDGRRIEAASASKKNGALQQTNVRFAVKAVPAFRALGSHEPQRLPGAQGGGRNTHAAGDFADAQAAMSVALN
jgi:hypothetical protein